MDRVTTWLWRKNKKEAPREDSYWFDGEKIIICRADEDPANSNETISASDAMAMYVTRGYEKLAKHSQIMYDFLKLRGY